MDRGGAVTARAAPSHSGLSSPPAPVSCGRRGRGGSHAGRGSSLGNGAHTASQPADSALDVWGVSAAFSCALARASLMAA